MSTKNTVNELIRLYLQERDILPQTSTVTLDGSIINVTSPGGTYSGTNGAASGTTAIQNALTQGGYILFKAGTYTVTSALTIPTNSWVQGTGWNSTLFQRTSGTIMSSTADHVKVSDLGMSCTAASPATDGNLLFDGCDYVYVQNVRSTDSPSECIKARDCTLATFIGNYVERSMINAGTGKAGIMFSTSATGTSAQCSMIGNHAVDTGGEAFGVFAASGGTSNTLATITANTSRITTTGNRGHIAVEGSSGNAGTASITGNDIHSDYYGISVLNFQRTSITGNSITHFSSTDALDGIRVSGASDYHTITGNTLTNIAQNGILLEVSSRRLTVSGNTIINPSLKTTTTYDGIKVTPTGSACRQPTITGNNIIDDQGSPTMQYGINLTAGASQIINANVQCNTIVGAVTAGMLESGTLTSPIIRNNIGYVTENEGTGTINSGATSATITHGLAYTPSRAEITITLGEDPTNTPGAIFVTSIGATTFDVNSENDPGASNLDFSWSVRRI